MQWVRTTSWTNELLPSLCGQHSPPSAVASAFMAAVFPPLPSRLFFPPNQHQRVNNSCSASSCALSRHSGSPCQQGAGEPRRHELVNPHTPQNDMGSYYYPHFTEGGWGAVGGNGNSLRLSIWTQGHPGSTDRQISYSLASASSWRSWRCFPRLGKTRFVSWPGLTPLCSRQSVEALIWALNLFEKLSKSILQSQGTETAVFRKISLSRLILGGLFILP